MSLLSWGNIAAACAAQRAVPLAQELRATATQFEGDAVIALAALEQSDEDNSPMGPVIL
ncbi:hypothetical protein C1H46_001176 [Malus baccata]|uniref:Uncharacterized protein n=1 Tax=Malus baccata TaxID=106549 RepID=A0A540NPY5_MALBA|nr:hypothetical protein C1H46_001176 [Malus baccata]